MSLQMTLLTRLLPLLSTHLDATTVLSRKISELGIYPAVDPLDSNSRILNAEVLGDEHYNTAMRVKEILQRYKELQDIIAILGMDELSDEDKESGTQGKKGTTIFIPAFPCSRSFYRNPGVLVDIKDTIKGFNMIIDGRIRPPA